MKKSNVVSKLPWLVIILVMVLGFAVWYHLNFHVTDSVSVAMIEDDKGNDKNVVATANAVPVNALEIATVTVGTRVIFADESFIDLATCEMNKTKDGPTLAESSPMIDDCKQVTKERPFNQTSTLSVEDVVVDAKVILWHEKNMKVTLAGPQKLVNKIMLTEEDNKLRIDGSAMKDSVAMNAVPGHTSVLQMTVYVPMYTGITVEGKAGNMNIENIQGVLEVDVNSGNITAGAMQVVDIQATDKAHVIVASATSSLYVDADQQSHVEILGGNVHRAKLMATNKSSIEFDGIATNAHSKRDKGSTITIAKATDISVTDVNDDYGKVGFSQ